MPVLYYYHIQVKVLIVLSGRNEVKMKKILTSLILVISFAFIISAGCAQDPYKDYISCGLDVKKIDFDYEDMDSFTFGYNKTELFTDYQEYLKYNFDLPYTNEYFKQNDLLVFVVRCCSSDGMEFGEILQDNGRLYPLFYRNKFDDGAPVTDDIIILFYYAEVPKVQNYSSGEIIYRYR